MIIEVDAKATILSKRAEAVLLVIDDAGNETIGLKKVLPDIAQLIDMMAMCKELVADTLLDFETEKARLFVITHGGISKTFHEVINKCIEAGIKSINIPAIKELEIEAWGLEQDNDLLVSICG